MVSYALELSKLEGTYCYCNGQSAGAIRMMVSALPLAAAHMLGSGDYHYASYFFLERIEEPFVLALFDHHPDDRSGAFDAGMLSCGNWVARARKDLPLMRNDYLNTPHIPEGLPVYVSVDLDVLSPEYARTDWDQGDRTLDGLLDDLQLIKGTHRILGLDICGAPGKPLSCDLALNRRAEEAIISVFR